MLSNILTLNFWFLKIIYFFHTRHYPKIKRHILKDEQKNKRVSIHKIIRLIIMKMKMKMKKAHVDTI